MNRSTPARDNSGLSAAVFGLGVTLLTGFGAVYIKDIPLFVTLAGPLVVGLAAAIGMYSLMQHNRSKETGIFARVVSIMIFCLIAVCAYTALRSIWINPTVPLERYEQLSWYENAATITGIAAIILAAVLSTFHDDTYWLSRPRKGTLDERQLTQRQQVFEISYRLAAYIVAAAAWFAATRLDSLVRVIQLHNGTVPGHVLWLPACLVIVVFVLPSVVASWQKR